MIQTAKRSIEEYHKIVDAGILGDRHIELLKGALIELSPETPEHTNRNHTAYKYLLSLFDGLADVRSGHPVTLSTSEPEPDIVLAQLPESRYGTKHPYPDDIYLVIEVSYSTLTYDLELKKRIYADAKIAEYWVIDLQNRQLIIFQNPQDSDYQVQINVKAGSVSSKQFPQVQVGVERLLA